MKKLFFIVITACFAVLNLQAQTYNNEWIDYSKTYYKFYVGSNGLHRISQPVLSGLGLGAVAAQQFQLWRNGVEVPIYTSVSSGVLSSSDFIEFYGYTNDGSLDTKLYAADSLQMSNKLSLYTDSATYFLTVNATGPNKRITDAANNVAGNVLTAEPYFMHKLSKNMRVKMNQGYGYDLGELVSSASYESAEGWTSNDIATGTKLTDNNAGIKLYASGPTATLYAVIAGNAYTTRTATIKLNTTTLLSQSINGYDIKRLTINNIPLSAFTSDAANIEFSNTSSSSSDKIVVSNYELTYPRTFNFGGASIFNFDLASNPNGYYLEISNFTYGSGTPILYDITNGLRYTAVVASGVIKFALPPSATSSSFVLMSSDVSKVVAVNNISSRNFVDYSQIANQGDYVIITHPLLQNDGAGNNYINDYAQYRSSVDGGSYHVAIVDINQLTDQFAFGIKHHPAAVRFFADYAVDKFSQTPSYFYLIGKGLNYVDYRAKESDPNVGKLALIPVFGEPASDNLLTASRTGHYPRIAIGRLSAITGSEIKTYLDKIKEYESVQRNTAHTIAEKAWMKNTAQVTGGLEDPGLYGLITSYMQGYSEICSDTLMGAKVYQFSANTGSNKAVGSDKTIENLMSEGVSVITYFGHSSPNTIEFSLDNPEGYNNPGKYPLIIINGCESGNLFKFDTLRAVSKGTLSEKFVFANKRGSIGYIASTHFGLPTQLNYFNTAFFKNASKDMYGQTLGDILKTTMQSVVSDYPADYIAQAHAEEITLHGDPALRLNAHPLPDYVIQDSLLTFSPGVVSVADKNVTIKIKVMNIGKATGDSLKIKVEHILPDNSQKIIYNQKIKAVKFDDSISIVLPLNPLLHTGVNNIRVTLDPDSVLTELSETNNIAVKSFTVLENEVRPIYPYEYAIVNNPSITYFASTADPIAAENLYVMEIDTTKQFNSPLKITTSTLSNGGVIAFNPSITYTDSTVYYWRVTVGNPNQNSYWNTSSFVYINGSSGGFNQSHYYQYKNDTYTAMSIDRASRRFMFNPKISKLLARVGTYPYYSWDQNNVNMDDIQVDYWGCTINAVQFYVFDSTTLAPWENYNVSGSGRFGSNPVCNEPRRFFDFAFGQQSYRKKAMDFFDSIPNGMYVLVRNLLFNSNTSFINSWKADTATFGSGKSLWHKFHENGLTLIDSFKTNIPFLFLFKKGDTTNFIPQQEIGAAVNEQIVKSYFLDSKEVDGSVTTPWLGPAKEWKNFQWDETESSAGTQKWFDIIGKDNFGNEILMAQVFDAKDTSISFIDANYFPYLKLVMHNNDPYNAKATQLKYWRLTGSYYPEGAIAPNLAYQFQENLTDKDTLHFRVAFKNISAASFDSIRVKLVITDNKGVAHTYNNLQNGRMLKPLLAGDTVIVYYNIPVKNYIGHNQLFLEVNPDDDQLEQYHFNNVLYKAFYVGTPVPCPGGIAKFYSSGAASGATFQWQEDDGTGFKDVSNAGIYSGATTDTLTLNGAPSSMYGYKYKCKITKNSVVTYSDEFALKFSLYWTGAVDTDWHNSANWSCDVVPDGNTDVIINSDLTNYPVINQEASCRSLTAKPGSSVSINSDKQLIITGH